MEIATFFKQYGINADIFEVFMKENLKTKSYDKGHILQQPEKTLLRIEKLMLYDTVKNYSSMVRMLKFLSAKERYKLLLKEHPNILQRVSLGHIASYLGISQQTLSVIRGQK